ncbi:helix-turn-helix domain-containing protein [Bdellovibrio bacteriovorus]|uniref:helix-turn-helix domain-containing protein n=1 Tax=Bdellovibrio bacteriovorus TaxID=959 RepID=UPI0002D95863
MSLKKLIEQKGISQIQLASELGVSDASISKWVNWGFPIPPKHLHKVAKILNCEVEVLKKLKSGGHK